MSVTFNIFNLLGIARLNKHPCNTLSLSAGGQGGDPPNSSGVVEDPNVCNRHGGM